jgi:hypothetical protein
MLSFKGAACATSDFFASFQGNITVGSNYGWAAHDGWFDAMIEATKIGLRVDTVLPLSVDSQSIRVLFARLSSKPDGAKTKFRKLCIEYTGSSRCFERSRPDISSLYSVAEHVEVGLQLEYCQLSGLATTAALLDSSISRSSLKELTIRSNIPQSPLQPGDTTD